MRDLWRVKPGSKVSLAAIDTASTPGLKGGREAAAAARPASLQTLAPLQDKLWAESTRCLLVILQGMDAAGKDGTVKHVFEGLNPEAIRTTEFKVPTSEELAHDFLWRISRALPRRGQIGVFNRSQYEDVVAVRVRKNVPESVWRPRFRSIAEFERALVHEGTTIVKCFLHISKDEQKKRFEERLRLPDKRWKFSPDDLIDRNFWDAYRRAYEEAISATSTDHAPWYIIPADHKWYLHWAVDVVLVETLQEMDPHYPDPPNLDGIQVL
ncbi:MAG: polyphosphate kinase 2 family protein [Candidatus Dormibacteraeota bacterium]|nr:polyphosphate kinase 2 family protein [Candidatus Dormibacteraeota bacterium]